MTMPRPDAADPDDRQTQLWLHQALYRFDCPSAHTLGEYQLGLLPVEQQTALAAHAVDCDACRAELTTLRNFLQTPISAPEPMLSRARRVLAALMTPAPRTAYGGLRGAAQPAVRVYEVEDITVTIGPGQGPGSLIGLLMVTSLAPEDLVGRTVRLLASDGAPRAAALDDIGNFEFDGLPPGPSSLELELPDRLLVVEDVLIA